ncbi:MAG TPA: hypothetical protein VM943_00760 [Pyrinomonadaceae bacterium]|nr:hypothetical protein [Pyrinomonadaceae bacterium]
MFERLTQLFNSLPMTPQSMVWGLVIFIVTLTGSLALVSFVLVKLPATYFQAAHPRDFWTERHKAIRWSGMVVKNCVGLLLVALGVVMSLPGIPGQGILTILLGIMLLDFPGKRRLENKLVSRPKVLQGINRLRAKFGKPPLLLD